MENNVIILRMNEPIIIIPVYQPLPVLLTLVQQLCIASCRVIIINDGSDAQYLPLFDELCKIPHVEVLHHTVNQGKGQALKTAFQHFLIHYRDVSPGVVTADADGQHTVEDILVIARALQQNPNALLLGKREFGEAVPWRSRFGNQLTRNIFKWVSGTPISDTQTGLRGIPADFVAELVSIHSKGYEFELDMLMTAVRQKREIIERPIKTIYENNNASSHFNPFLDSLKIYFVFFRFSALSLTTALLDYLVFTFIYLSTHHILTSFIGARLVAGTFNFICNKSVVFKSKGRIGKEAVKFAGLVITLMLAAYVLVNFMVNQLNMNVYVSKVIAEGGLFFASFIIQRLFIFRRRLA